MKMPPSNALFFPETTPFLADTAPLLLLLGSLTFYRPTESPHTQHGSPLPDADLWHDYAPAPLGEKLDPFLRMVTDLRGHAGEYYGGFLSTLSPGVASFQEESVRQLISAMTGGAAAPNGKARAREEALWQARLLLQLAENLYFEEREVAENLARVAAKQQRMLHSLMGDDQTEEELPLPSFQPQPPRLPIRDSLLCRAWSRLFLADQRADRPRLLATANHDAAELIHQAYEKITGQTHSTLCQLPLPALTGLEGPEYLPRRKAFRQTAAAPIGRLTEAMTEAIASGRAPAFDGEALAAHWTAAIAAHFEATDTSRQLAISLYPNVSLTALCRQLGRREDDPPAGTEAPPHGLLVHLLPVI